MISLKDHTVHLKGLQPEMLLGHCIVVEVFRKAGLDCIITSANDSQHMNGSLHYQGLALDYRWRDVAPALRPALLTLIREKLQPDFDVVEETIQINGTPVVHLHVEFQPKNPVSHLT